MICVGRSPSRAIATARLRGASAWRNPVGVDGGDRGAARQHHAHRLGDQRRRRGGAHHHAGAGARGELVTDDLDLVGIDSPARCLPHTRRQSLQAPSRSPLSLPVIIGPVTVGIAGTSALAAPIRSAGTVLSQPPIRTTAVHRLSADHLFRVDRHQVAQEHRRRVGERLVDRHDRELDRQRARQHHAALHRLDDVGDVAIAGVEAGERVGDADERTVQRVVRIAHRLDESLAQEQREPLAAVRREALLHTSLRRGPRSVFGVVQGRPSLRPRPRWRLRRG